MSEQKDPNSIIDLLLNHGSDKVTYHSYGPIYEELFKPYKESAIAILELGILEGNSIRAWRDYFTNAIIYGIDNEAHRLVDGYRIQSIQADTKDRDGLIALAKTLPQFDIIIDDASHVIMEQLYALPVFWHNLRPGGLYIVEDVYKPEYLELFSCFPNATLYDLRDKRGQRDDLLAVMRK